MDVSSSLFQLQDNSEFLFDCENFLEQSFSASDAGYYSACSSLSPASSTDSCCFSPPGQDALFFQKSFSLKTSSVQEDKKKAKVPKRTGRPRTKFPGVKRQNASEREKLRMRDLTKALHHLRNYLPPSVAPAGQTLTKIETLRLTINYINYLSAQLELGQEEDSQMNVLTRVQDTPTVPVNQVAPQTQIYSSQEFFNMPNLQRPDNVSLPSSMSQEYCVLQQHYCFYGQC